MSEAQAARQAAATADQKAVAGDTKATAAQEAATTADGKAVTADRKAEDALGRINRLSLASLENYQVTETQTVTFPVNRSSLSNDAKATLDGIARSVQNQRAYVIELRGFTDSTGSESYNDGLSQRRAESVRRYLVEKNVPLLRISLVGLGKSNPAADNRTVAGRQQNRRVQIQVLRAQGQSGM
jgi:outer membrane protein OmpA-like peptidoglycan-associated protein